MSFIIEGRVNFFFFKDILFMFWYVFYQEIIILLTPFQIDDKGVNAYVETDSSHEGLVKVIS